MSAHYNIVTENLGCKKLCDGMRRKDIDRYEADEEEF